MSVADAKTAKAVTTMSIIMTEAAAADTVITNSRQIIKVNS